VRAVILAAGAGTRLTGSGVVRPKCLAPFEGRTLLDLQIDALRRCGIDDLTIVIGFEGDRIRRACGPGVRFIENPAFATSNSLYSLWLARAVLTDGFVVLNCDVLFHPLMLGDLLTARHDNALLVSYPTPSDVPYGDEEMKVCVRRGCVVDIGKDLDPAAVDGENVGIAKFSPAGAGALIGIMDAIVASGSLRDWAPRAFGEFARRDPLHALGTRGLPWTEIDTPEDYERAVRDVFPALRDSFRTLFRRGA
jgi:choline kinase